MIPPGSVEMGPASPRGPVFVRPRVDVADEEPPSNAAPTPEEPAAAPDDAEPAPPPPLSPLPPGVRVPQGEERDVLLARIQARVISSSSDSEASEELHDAAPLDEEDPEAAAPTATEAPPRHKPLQQRVSP